MGAKRTSRTRSKEPCNLLLQFVAFGDDSVVVRDQPSTYSVSSVGNVHLQHDEKRPRGYEAQVVETYGTCEVTARVPWPALLLVPGGQGRPCRDSLPG